MKKTTKVMAGISSTALMFGLTGCGPSVGADLPPVPEGTDCADWEWDMDDGVWECDDNNSQYFGHYFYGGKLFKTKSALFKDQSYLSYKNSSSFKGGSVSKGSSGFGSGAKFGG